MTIKHLYLDLEDTLIAPIVDGWLNFHVLRLDPIIQFIEQYRPDYVHVFSFAIRSDDDLLKFKFELKPYLEKKLGIEFSRIPTFNEIKKIACESKGVSPDWVSTAQVEHLWSKGESFRLYVQRIHRNAKAHGNAVEVVLIDDMVQNELFSWPDLDVGGQLINVYSL